MRQQRRDEELAVELLVETDVLYRKNSGVDTVGGPPLEGKGIRNISRTDKSMSSHEIEWYRVSMSCVSSISISYAERRIFFIHGKFVL